MRFVRVTVNHTRGIVIAVMQQDSPFTTGGEVRIDGELCETIDFGAVEDQLWTDLEGRPCSLTQHVLQRLEAGRDPAVAKVHDCPCTLEGLKERLRRRGPAGVPVKVRA